MIILQLRGSRIAGLFILRGNQLWISKIKFGDCCEHNAQSRTAAAQFEQQHKQAEANDNPDQHPRDEALGLSLLVTLSCGCRSV
jgi:hypothetical protein